MTIPRGTALVTAHVGTGGSICETITASSSRTSRRRRFAQSRRNGSGYVESLRGRVTASNSTFDRLRARTATGNMIFRGCTSHQIEATSNYGSIVYDNGRFQPGLAHFESVHGNVALGVRGGAQIGARSGSGHIVSSFPNGAQLRGRRSAQATVRGGGPMVTAVSKHGSVYIYNGSMRAHPRVQSRVARRPDSAGSWPAAPSLSGSTRYRAPARQASARRASIKRPRASTKRPRVSINSSPRASINSSPRASINSSPRASINSSSPAATRPATRTVPSGFSAVRRPRRPPRPTAAPPIPRFVTARNLRMDGDVEFKRVLRRTASSR